MYVPIVTGACPVTTDLIMRVNVRTTTTTTYILLYYYYYLLLLLYLNLDGGKNKYSY